VSLDLRVSNKDSQAIPLNSSLLQQFLTRLQPEIRHQLLLQKKPSNFTSALANAVDIEYVLKFNGSDDSVHAVSQPQRKLDLELPDIATLQCPQMR